jgi:hypothetical protein
MWVTSLTPKCPGLAPGFSFWCVNSTVWRGILFGFFAGPSPAELLALGSHLTVMLGAVKPSRGTAALASKDRGRGRGGRLLEQIADKGSSGSQKLTASSRTILGQLGCSGKDVIGLGNEILECD